MTMLCIFKRNSAANLKNYIIIITCPKRIQSVRITWQCIHQKMQLFLYIYSDGISYLVCKALLTSEFSTPVTITSKPHNVLVTKSRQQLTYEHSGTDSQTQSNIKFCYTIRLTDNRDRFTSNFRLVECHVQNFSSMKSRIKISKIKSWYSMYFAFCRFLLCIPNKCTKYFFFNVTDYYVQVLQITRLKPSKIHQADTLRKLFTYLQLLHDLYYTCMWWLYIQTSMSAFISSDGLIL